MMMLEITNTLLLFLIVKPHVTKTIPLREHGAVMEVYMAKRVIETIANKGQKDERTISIEIDCPSNLGEAVKKFGEQLVFEKFVDAHDVAFQAFVRGLLTKDGDKKLSNQQITQKAKEWKPSQRKAADPAKKTETLKKMMASLDPKARAALLAELAKQV